MKRIATAALAPVAFAAARGGTGAGAPGGGRARAGDAAPDWSPDGARIIFASTRDGTRSSMSSPPRAGCRAV